MWTKNPGFQSGVWKFKYQLFLSETVIKSSLLLFLLPFIPGVCAQVPKPSSCFASSSACSILGGRGRNISVPWKMETSQGWGPTGSMFFRSVPGTCFSYHCTRIHTFPEICLITLSRICVDSFGKSLRPMCIRLQNFVWRVPSNYCGSAAMYSTFTASPSTALWMESWGWKAATRQQYKKPKRWAVTNTQAHPWDRSLKKQTVMYRGSLASSLIYI